MKNRVFIIIMFLVLSSGAFAQPPETIYLGTVAQDGYVDDQDYGPYNIGFTFNFYGNNYTQFYINSNGQVTFGARTSESAAVDIPNAALPNNYISAFWDDLVVDSYGTILYKTIGTAPNRELVVQFKNMGFYPFPANLGTFSIILYETSNKIQVQYRLIVLTYSGKAHGGNATIGLENAAGTAGAKYAFHNPSGVDSEQAISFTPVAGPSYTINSSAVYDGVYLTTNLALPEPSITNLITPPSDAVMGTDITFEWASTPNAASYTLYLGTDPELIGATAYPAGSNLSYTVTGLTVNETYYWGVFAKNATGTTWCEIIRFTTATLPPLTPVPQTIWVEKPLDKVIKLQYTGGDGSPKTAIVTTDPGHGELYQYNAGVRGSQITAPATVTDAGMNIIYAATGNTGNGVGNFNFKIHDSSGDSPERTITVNVSPANIPHVLYFAKNTKVEIQFDIPMADPAGKENQFTVTNNGTPLTISAASLKPGDPYTIELTTTTPPSGTVLISYAQGDVAGLAGGLLLPFTNEPVTLTAQTITFSQSLTKKYSDSPFVLTGSASSSLGLTWSSSNLPVVTIVSNVATFHALGTSDITAAQTGNATYAPAKYIRPLTVDKGDQVITFGILAGKTYGDADYSISATAGSALPVSFSSDNTSVATVTGTTVHIVGAGTAIITASQGGDGLWNPAPDVPRTLTVTKAAATVTPGDLSKIYTGLGQGASATTSPAGLTVDFTYDGSAALPINAGSYAVVATVNDPNYQGTASATLVIAKAPLNATADNKSRLYGETNPIFTLTYTGFVNSETPTVIDAAPNATTTALQTTNTGTVPITVSGGNDNNYTFTYTDGTLTINKASLSVTADDKTRVYGDPNPVLTISYSGFVNSESASVIDTEPVASTTADATTNAGTAEITVSGGIDNNYTFTYVSGTLTITKATATVTPGGLSKIYTGLGQAASAATTPAGLTADFTYDGSAALPVNVGSYAVVATVNDLNYLGTASATLVIAKASLNAKADDKSRLYGEANPAFTLTYTGFVNSETSSVIDAAPSASSTALQTTDAGTVPITVTGGSDNNYELTYTDGTLTINKASLSVTADNKSKTYGDANPALTFSYSGFIGTDNEAVLDTPPLVTTTGLQTSDAGTYPITAAGGSDNNYVFNYVDGTLTINKADQSITFLLLPDKNYGDSDFTISASAGSSLPVTFASSSTSVAEAAGNIIHITGAGTTVITASQGGSVNYNPAPDVLQSLTINKAALTFTADDDTKQYGEPNPVLGFTITGFVNGDTQSVLDLLPSIQTTAVQNSPVGSYPVTVSGGNDNSYTFNYVAGTLTITKIQQTISFTDYPSKLLVGETYTLAATSTSGLTVEFESSNTQTASISNNLLTGVSKGDVQIRAFHPGDINYEAAEAFVSVEISSTHKDVMNLFTPNNDGINDYWELPDLDSWGKCDVRIYSRSGKLIYANANYNNLWDGTSNGAPVPEGAYYYIIKTENAGEMKGTVNIVR